ncbi:MAG: hypothetical protein ABEH90_00505 [Halolamina sp.]
MPTYGPLPAVDPDDATVVFQPPGRGEGYWVGAPCVHVHDGTTYLAVRLRTPEDRGYALRIYASEERSDNRAKPGDGYDLRAELTASALGVESLERPALVTDPHSGALKLYLPVDHGENDWTIQRLADVSEPAAFDPATAHDVLVPQSGTTDEVTVKDPCVVTVGGRYYMFYAGHDGQSEQAHLATSVDGEDWQRAPANPVLPRAGWHDHHTRVSAVVPVRGCPGWHVFYGGSGTDDYGNTWNLRTGVATAQNLKRLTDTTPDGPWLSTATADKSNATGFRTCRYLDVLDTGRNWELFFEAARRDGSFELRRATPQGPG